MITLKYLSCSYIAVKKIKDYENIFSVVHFHETGSDLGTVYILTIWQNLQEFLWTNSFTGDNNMMAFIAILASSGSH